jgi:threonylcarbamoyladenosine tRNA methylthiotransferase MtaB
MQFARLHVFPFSARPGTPAALMPGQVPPATKEERAQAMRTAGAASARAFRERFVGRALDVLWETERDGAAGRVWRGLTGNYLRVQAESSGELSNMLTLTRLMALDGDGLWGRIEAKKDGGWAPAHPPPADDRIRPQPGPARAEP